METQFNRDPRAIIGGGQAVALFDPESGQPVVYGTRVAGTPGAANNAVLFDIDLTGVMTALVQLTGTWSATVTFEQTIDGTVWFQVAGFRPDSPTSTPLSLTQSNAVLAFPAIGKRLRARVTPFSSGTVQSQVMLTDVCVVSLNAPTQSMFLAPTTNSGGFLAQRLATAASGAIGSSNRRLYGWTLMNTAAAARYLQVYNKTTAGVPGTDTPVATIPLPPSGTANALGEIGQSVGTGLAYAITTDAAGATIGAAGDVVGTLFYL